jgi:hypothetical protein
MDSSTSDFSITSDSDINLTASGYNLHSRKISPIAVLFILILLTLLIGFFINNISINNFEPNLEKIEKTAETKPEIKKIISTSPTDIKQTLNITNQELNNSINQLTDLINKTDSEFHHNSDEIKSLEKNIEDLKSEVIILQSKILDHELNKPEKKPTVKPIYKPEVKPQIKLVEKPAEVKMPNINITTEPIPNMSYTYNNFQDDVIIYDPIANYDRLKLTDPLVDPRGRSSADQIPTPQVAAQLNFPTQGVIDRYHRVGLLIAENNDSDNYHGNKKKLNILESSADYSTNKPTSFSPTYYADLGSRKYNGVDVVSNSNTDNSSKSSQSTSNSTQSISHPASVFTSSSPATITTLTPKSSKSEKHKKHKQNKHRKNKHKKEGFEIEGFATDSQYETFETSNNFDEDNNNFSILENSSYEGFGNMESKNTQAINLANGDNNILELIGQKITDNWYKYFTSISVGNKVIKINVHNRNRRELYDGDIVFVPEVGRRYRVQIDKMDMIEYNPYFF